MSKIIKIDWCNYDPYLGNQEGGTVMNKHTPGAWISDGKGVRSEGGYICFMSKPTKFTGQDQRYVDELQETIDNALLIAAAPDLLDACELAKKYLEPDLVEPGRTVFWKLVAALKKARGES